MSLNTIISVGCKITDTYLHVGAQVGNVTTGFLSYSISISV